MDSTSNTPLSSENYREHSDSDQYIQVDVVGIIKKLYKRKKLIVGTVLIVMILASIFMLLKPNKYKSHASILPSGKTDDMAAMKELIGLAGFAAGNDNNSSRLFPTILRSDYIKNALIDREFAYRHENETFRTSLRDYFNEDNLDYLKLAIDGITTIDMDKPTGVINVSVETKFPGLSQAILTEMLVELDHFNMYKRRSSAKENVRYLERELSEKEVELRAAEDSLEAYQMTNRNWYNSTDPRLLKTISRIKQNIEVLLQTYKYLRTQYENARLEAQKDIPVVRILDAPSLPILKSSPHRAKTVLIAGMLAFMLTSLTVIMKDSIKHRFKGDNDTRRRLTMTGTSDLRKEDVKV
ncbi:MAG: hypothetical protein GF315_02490 [candidate division Zixibacteria bacterium]|nr:hypothetical protein [candidate division Zixibacteria bacterium]